MRHGGTYGRKGCCGANSLLWKNNQYPRASMRIVNSIALILLFQLTAIPSHAFSYSPQVDLSRPIDEWPPLKLSNFQFTRYSAWQPYPDTMRIQVVISTTRPSAISSGVEAAYRTLDFPCSRSIDRREYTCGGVFVSQVYTSGEVETPTESAIFNAAKVNIERAPIRLELYYNGPEIAAGRCDLFVSLEITGNGGGRWGYRDSSCSNTTPPQTVHCSVTGPSVLTHPDQKTTGISSKVHDIWTVSCSGTSTVTLSTTSDVKLRSGSDKIDSGLYIEAEGVTTLDLTAGNYPHPVAILSKLKSSTAQPGSYQGSGIITVSWP